MWPPPPRPIGATVGMLGSSDSTLVSGESKQVYSRCLERRQENAHLRLHTDHGPTPLTYRSHRHLRHRHVPEPRTPAHPPVRPPTRISSGPCTLRSPRSAIPMTPSVAPIRRVRMRIGRPFGRPRSRPDMSCSARPRRVLPGRACDPSELAVGGVLGRARRSGAPDQWREATHGQRASGKRASKS